MDAGKARRRQCKITYNIEGHLKHIWIGCMLIFLPLVTADHIATKIQGGLPKILNSRYCGGTCIYYI